MLVSYKDAKHCYYCELPFNKQTETPFSKQNVKTREHVIPIANGGKGGIKNIIAACYFCNQLKGRLSLDDFFNLIMVRGFRKTADNEGRDLNIVLQNIAKLKTRIQAGEDLILSPVPPVSPFSSKKRKKVHKEALENHKVDMSSERELELIKSRDWFANCKFPDDDSKRMFARTVKIVEGSKARKLTHYEGYELYERIRCVKVELPSPNFHEDFILHGVVPEIKSPPD